MLFAQDDLVNSLKANASDSAKVKFTFTNIINLENGPVKTKEVLVPVGVILAIHL